ncbi:unnamed protein product [Vitrella brassicaformis CCMP3155]|uniref:PsbP C-terminal domain-containing protein n=1 Tax=Vitrella brassicaformis (strain CCMP3155) TaxID=1169540 RepID=A0A0G4G8D0_VITBC|nr:unnamed protein product [Vitrella brassicaformis CCMP3155]|eukprot:CEM24604.1 unnamed protein product [Vitrella brassicaformis CCMP3155]
MSAEVPANEAPVLISRRQRHSSGAAAAASLLVASLLSNDAAAAEALAPFTWTSPYPDDTDVSLSLELPKEWSLQGPLNGGMTGSKLFIATDPQDESKRSILINLIPLRGDFASIGSLGGPSKIREIITGGVAEGDSVKLLAEEMRSGNAYVELIQSTSEKPKMHMLSVWTLMQGGGRNWLGSVTLSVPEDSFPAFKPTSDAIVKSLKVTQSSNR